MDHRVSSESTLRGNVAPALSASAGRQRLLVMSNRAPIRLVRANGREQIVPTVGGVGTTFLRLLERSGGLWIAWSGGKNSPARMMMPPADPRFTILFPRLTQPDVP